MIKTCEICGVAFQAKRKDARYCSATCRKRASNGYTASDGLEAPAKVACRPFTVDEVAKAVDNAANAAADLSRAAQHTPAPFCLKLSACAKQMLGALDENGLLF